MRLGLRLLIALVAAIPVVQTQTLPPGVAKKASAGGITEYVYPNGLRVLLYPNPATDENLRWALGWRRTAW